MTDQGNTTTLVADSVDETGAAQITISPERMMKMTPREIASYLLLTVLITVVTVVTNYLTESDILNRMMNKTAVN